MFIVISRNIPSSHPREQRARVGHPTSLSSKLRKRKGRATRHPYRSAVSPHDIARHVRGEDASEHRKLTVNETSDRGHSE